MPVWFSSLITALEKLEKSEGKWYIDLRQTKGDVLLPLERLETSDLDVQAQDKGYSPCA